MQIFDQAAHESQKVTCTQPLVSPLQIDVPSWFPIWDHWKIQPEIVVQPKKVIQSVLRFKEFSIEGPQIGGRTVYVLKFLIKHTVCYIPYYRLNMCKMPSPYLSPNCNKSWTVVFAKFYDQDDDLFDELLFHQILVLLG